MAPPLLNKGAPYAKWIKINLKSVTSAAYQEKTVKTLLEDFFG